jgi:hypothetical protein
MNSESFPRVCFETNLYDPRKFCVERREAQAVDAKLPRGLDHWPSGACERSDSFVGFVGSVHLVARFTWQVNAVMFVDDPMKVNDTAFWQSQLDLE